MSTWSGHSAAALPGQVARAARPSTAPAARPATTTPRRSASPPTGPACTHRASATRSRSSPRPSATTRTHSPATPTSSSMTVEHGGSASPHLPPEQLLGPARSHFGSRGGRTRSPRAPRNCRTSTAPATPRTPFPASRSAPLAGRITIVAYAPADIVLMQCVRAQTRKWILAAKVDLDSLKDSLPMLQVAAISLPDINFPKGLLSPPAGVVAAGSGCGVPGRW